MMEFSTKLTNELAEAFAREFKEYLSDHPDTRARKLERELRRMMHELGAACLEAALNALDASYPEEEVPCACGGKAK